MDASQLWFPEIVHSGPKYEFCTFYMSNVSEMLRNPRKHHFGSNGLEWMLHNFGTPKYCLRARNTSFLLLHAEALRNAPKHFHTSFWVQWTWMDASQLWYPEIVHSGWNTSFASFTCPRLAKCHETLQNIILGPMDTSQLWYPEIVHLGPKHKFCILLRAEG
jgi:hypothetical protein